MSEDNSSPYKSLPSKTSIRVLLLAPGAPDDEIFCWLLPVELNADHERFPSSSPRPVDIISVVVGTTSDGEERNFLVPFDIYWDEESQPGNLSTPMHPFQRYTALSYVWGDTSNPVYIILNGEKRFRVTRNLHSALKSLRSENEGLRLWVDALCINQVDYEEKKTQIGLMRRVYQQAEKVVAYVPQTEEDQENIQEIVYKIWTAGKLYEQNNEKTGMSSQKEDKTRRTGLISVPDLDSVTFNIGSEEREGGNRLKYEAELHELRRKDPNRGQFLEEFGLPPPDSPLWGSWRRFFASPYFRRIWILQEFALAKEVKFALGTKMASIEPIMVARHFIKEYSGAVNADYLGHSHEGDPAHLTQDAVAGVRGADLMFLERLLAQKGPPEELLVEKLGRGRSFDATDPRDKIYALVGLAKDGDLFTNYINYTPDETPAKTFTRFAGLFVKCVHVFEVLLQAGIWSCDAGLPSWVPNWADSARLLSSVSSSNGGISEQTSSIQLVSDDKLLIRGAITDEIRHLSAGFMGMTAGDDPELPHDKPPVGGTLVDFIRGFVKGALLVLRVIDKSQHSSDEAMNALFEVLIQKETYLNTMHSNEDEIALLRSGFESCLGFLKVWATSNLGDIEEGKGLQFNVDSPSDFQSFLQRAFQTTAHARLCVTSRGCIGLVPDRTAVSDLVVLFDGSPVQFILRNASLDEGDTNHDKVSYRLIGSGHFHQLPKGDNLCTIQEIQREIILI